MKPNFSSRQLICLLRITWGERLCVCVFALICVFALSSRSATDAAGGIVVLHSCKYDDICFHEVSLRLSGVFTAATEEFL